MEQQTRMLNCLIKTNYDPLHKIEGIVNIKGLC